MACRILENKECDEQCFYDSVTMTAFGPIMYGDADEFQVWLTEDARKIPVNVLHDKYYEFRKAMESSVEEPT